MAFCPPSHWRPGGGLVNCPTDPMHAPPPYPGYDNAQPPCNCDECSRARAIRESTLAAPYPNPWHARDGRYQAPGYPYGGSPYAPCTLPCCAPQPVPPPAAAAKPKEKGDDKKKAPPRPAEPSINYAPIPHGATYLHSRSPVTYIDAIEPNTRVWEAGTPAQFDFQTHVVPVDISVTELMNRLGGGDKGWKLSLVDEVGGHSWRKLSTYDYNSDPAKVTLAKIGWAGRGGTDLPPVFVVLWRDE